MDVLDGFTAAAEQAADAAGLVLRRYFRTAIPAQRKADDSPVTQADREAEQAMREVLHAAYPDHDILGEEAGLERATSSGVHYRWTLDPIDGTRAFITGRPLFGTLIGLMQDDLPLLGIIDQPVSGERWIGQSGRATRFAGGMGAVGTRARRGLDECELSCTSPAMFGAAETLAWQRLARRVGRTTYGGDCYAYGLLALGMIDIVAEAGLKPWDWVPLVPIVHGAGGSLTDWTGAPLRAGGDGRVLALADPLMLASVAAILAGRADREDSVT